jgi:hypothetical protein
MPASDANGPLGTGRPGVQHVLRQVQGEHLPQRYPAWVDLAEGRDADATTGHHEPKPPAQGGCGVGQEEQDQARGHGVVRAAPDGRCLGVVDHELDVVEPGHRHDLPATLEHAGRDVRPDHRCRPDRGRDLEQDGATPATDVELALPGAREHRAEQARRDRLEERDADVVVTVRHDVEQCADSAGRLGSELIHDPQHPTAIGCHRSSPNARPES